MDTKEWTRVPAGLIDGPENTLTRVLWTGDGRLFIAREDRLQDGREHVVMFLQDLQSNTWEQLPIEIFQNYGAPELSPDGRWIAWIEKCVWFDHTCLRLKLYDRQTGTTHEVANSEDSGTWLWKQLIWAPDSRRLAFTAHCTDKPCRHEGDTTLWTLRIEESK